MLKSWNHVSSQNVPAPHFFPYLWQQLHHLMSHKLTTWVPFSTPLRFPHKSCWFSSHCHSEICAFFPTYATIIQSLQFLATGSVASSLTYSLPLHSEGRSQLLLQQRTLSSPIRNTRKNWGRWQKTEWWADTEVLREEGKKNLYCEKYNASY